MSGRPRTLFRVARTMISDDAIVSGLVLALLGDARYAAWLFNSESWQSLRLLASSWISRGKELRRWGMWNSRNREDRDPGRLA